MVMADGNQKDGQTNEIFTYIVWLNYGNDDHRQDNCHEENQKKTSKRENPFKINPKMHCLSCPSTAQRRMRRTKCERKTKGE